jgi:hypothetical protein
MNNTSNQHTSLHATAHHTIHQLAAPNPCADIEGLLILLGKKIDNYQKTKSCVHDKMTEA